MTYEFKELTDNSDTPVRDYQSGDKALVVNGNGVAMVDMDSAQVAMDARIEELRGWIAGHLTYKTLADVQAVGEPPNGEVALVWADPVQANNGYWGWDSGNWIKTDLDFYDRFVIPVTDINQIGFVKLDGSVQSDAGWRNTGLVELPVGAASIRFDAVGHPSVCSIAFFSDARSFLSGTNSNISGRYSSNVSVPADAQFFNVTQALTAEFNQSTMVVVDHAKALSKLDTAKAGITSIVDLIDRVTQVGYIQFSGSIVSDSNWRYSGYIGCSEGDVISIDAKGHTAITSVVFYDSGRRVLEKNASDGSNSGRIMAQFFAPESARFVRLSFGTDEYSGFAAQAHIKFNDSQKTFSASDAATTNESAIKKRALLTNAHGRRFPLTPQSKIVVYGDSISADYSWYPDQLTALTGAQAERGGFGGTQAWYQAQDAQLTTLYARNPDLVLFMPGGNDDGSAGSVGTFSGYVDGELVVAETDIGVDYNGSTFIQAVDHAVRRFKQQYYNIRLRAGVTGTDTNAEIEELMDAVSKPQIVLLSPLPQQRYDSMNPYSQPDNWYRKRDAVAEVALKNHVPYVDLMSLVGFDMSLEPFWMGTDNVNRGIYTLDGLHPNKYGYQVITQIICGELGF